MEKPSRYKSREIVQFTVISHGTPYAFNPDWITYDQLTDSRRRALDIQKDYVRLQDSSHVYILDNKGYEVEIGEAI